MANDVSILDHVFDRPGFEQMASGKAREAIQGMLYQIALRSQETEWVAAASRYALVYSTYAMAELSIGELLGIYNRLKLDANDRLLQTIVDERIASRIRFEANCERNALGKVQSMYGRGIGIVNKPDHPKIYCVSIPRLIDRRNRYHANLSLLGALDIDYLGVDVQTMTFDRKVIQYPASAGEIACMLSHRLIWERIVQDNVDQAVIFEDDAVVSDLSVLRASGDLGWNAGELDIVYLNNRTFGSLERIPREFHPESSQSYLLPLTGGCGAEGYWLSRSGAEKLLRLFEMFVAPVDDQIIAYTKPPSEIDDYAAVRRARNCDIQLRAKRLYPFIADHPPINHSSIMNRLQCGFCPGLWIMDQR